MGKNMSDADRIELFMDSFHQNAKRDFWERLRRSTNPRRWSDMQLRIHEDDSVELKNVPLSDDDVDLAVARFRKFLTVSEPVFLGDVLDAADRLGCQSETVEEARHYYDQLIDQKWKFRVHNERSVGIYIEGTPITWEQDLEIPLYECPEESLSLKDFAEVLFNEEVLHAFVPDRNEEVRSRVRTVTKSLRSSMQNVALAGTIYTTLLLHSAFAKHGSKPCTADNCKEQRILQAYREQYENQQAITREASS